VPQKTSKEDMILTTSGLGFRITESDRKDSEYLTLLSQPLVQQFHKLSLVWEAEFKHINKKFNSKKDKEVHQELAGFIVHYDDKSYDYYCTLMDPDEWPTEQSHDEDCMISDNRMCWSNLFYPLLDDDALTVHYFDPVGYAFISLVFYLEKQIKKALRLGEEEVLVICRNQKAFDIWASEIYDEWLNRDNCEYTIRRTKDFKMIPDLLKDASGTHVTQYG
jgi:hypothetical protein